LPNWGPLPQTSQRLAIFFNLQDTWVYTDGDLAVIRNQGL
jgi:hypothetical protein